MSCYYNEIDPYCAQWLRNLMAEGHIAPGDVDERSIEDVTPNDVRGYAQCHFFAGIGVWSHALHLAGWDDSRPVWTGSCPCQSFSAAGKGAGFADERHLWPAWFHLIRECRPPVVFGEQVAAAIRHVWLDLVQADMEGQGYACGHAVFGAHSVGAPHQRQRLFFVADALGERRAGERLLLRSCVDGSANGGAVSDMAESTREQLNGSGNEGRGRRELADGSGVGDSDGPRRGQAGLPIASGLETDGARPPNRRSDAGATSDFWRAAEWIACRDGKLRPVEPGTFPLAHGASARVGRLRAYGNAIVPQAAAAFVGAFMECGP